MNLSSPTPVSTLPALNARGKLCRRLVALFKSFAQDRDCVLSMIETQHDVSCLFRVATFENVGEPWGSGYACTLFLLIQRAQNAHLGLLSLLCGRGCILERSTQAGAVPSFSPPLFLRLYELLARR